MIDVLAGHGRCICRDVCAVLSEIVDVQAEKDINLQWEGTVARQRMRRISQGTADMARYPVMS